MAVDRSHKPDQRRHSIGGGGGGQRRAMLVTYGDRLARSGLRQHMQWIITAERWAGTDSTPVLAGRHTRTTTVAQHHTPRNRRLSIYRSVDHSCMLSVSYVMCCVCFSTSGWRQANVQPCPTRLQCIWLWIIP